MTMAVVCAASGSATVTLANNIISNNTAGGSGGGVYATDSRYSNPDWQHYNYKFRL